jgi:hypothetical protein
MHIWNSLEALGQARANFLFSGVPITAWADTAWHVEHAIIGEAFHDRVEIMTIECLEE